MAEDKILLEVQNLKKYFPVKGSKGPGVQAVENALSLHPQGRDFGPGG